MERQYLATERAHLMCPNMFFGMLMELKRPFDQGRVLETLNRMAEAHPFLKSLIAYEEQANRFYYDITSDSQITLDIKHDEKMLWDDYKAVSMHEWNVLENGLLKVYIYPNANGMKVLMIMHHLLVDGRGALQIAEEFANDYVGQIKPVYVEEYLMKNMNDLPPKSNLPFISKLIVKQANAQWNKENHKVSYQDYTDFIESYSKTHQVEYETSELNQTEVSQMLQLCHDNDFTMNDLLLAQMFLKTKTQKIIIAVDIRKDFPEYNPGALGNYATAMGIEYKTKTTDLVKIAKQVHKIVQKHRNNNRTLMLVLACYFNMTPELLDAAAISALGGFESKAGKFVGDGMFHFGKPSTYSITNLGKVENQNISSILFIPPASPAAKLTLGVVTLNGIMRTCSSKNVFF